MPADLIVENHLENKLNSVVHGPYCIINFLFIYLSKERVETAMTDFLLTWYLWIKTAHVIAVVSWMAGLFYLPRLFVYHVEQVQSGSATDEMFQTMERRLLRGIMGPAMIATWVFGLCLVWTPGLVDWAEIWPWVKAVAVIGMTGFHQWLGGRRREFMAGKNQLTGRQYRLANEIPTLLLVVIVAAVIVKF